MAEKVAGVGGGASPSAAGNVGGSRIERRKAAKKERRKQKRKELAAKEREEEEARLNDPEEQLRIQLEEEREKERVERERREFEEHERVFLEALAAKRKVEEEEEEEERRKTVEDESKHNQVGRKDKNSDDDWEYVEEGPPEIIWQGNEIIVKKKKVRVKKKDTEHQIKKEDPNRPTSNPLPPQSEAFADHKKGVVVSAQQLLDNVAQQTPNFGTEQYTDEEVERSYEEFYEDVHTEFLKFGELVNFKVCKNGSSHLRGNVYIHYKSLDSALAAYQSINGRYFAGKQVTCEFIGVTKWKVAICGEYMKSRLKTCSRGTACNFIHCFRNPGGDYEWADVDRPPPNYWANKMAALFGYSEEYGYDNHVEQEGRNSSKIRTADSDSYYRRSRSTEGDSSRSHYEEYDARSSRHFDRHHTGSRKAMEAPDGKNRGRMYAKNSRESNNRRTHDSDSDGDWPARDGDEDIHQSNTRRNSRNRIEVLETQDFHVDRGRRDRHHINTRDSSRHYNEVLSPDNIKDKRERMHDHDSREEDEDRHHKQKRKRSRHSNEGLGSIHEHANAVGKSKDKNNSKESNLEKVEPPKVKKRHRSRRGDRSSMEPSETNASAEGLKSNVNHETTSSGHGERTKSRDIANMRHLTSCRDSSSDESSYETQSRRLYGRRSKSHDSGYNSSEDLDKWSRWESDKIGLEKHRENERKPSSSDFDRYGGNSNSQDPDAAECHRDRRSRGSGWSSSRKSSDELEGVDSAEECEESNERQKKHRRKHRTHGHK